MKTQENQGFGTGGTDKAPVLYILFFFYIFLLLFSLCNKMNLKLFFLFTLISRSQYIIIILENHPCIFRLTSDTRYTIIQTYDIQITAQRSTLCPT